VSILSLTPSIQHVGIIYSSAVNGIYTLGLELSSISDIAGAVGLGATRGAENYRG